MIAFSHTLLPAKNTAQPLARLARDATPVFSRRAAANMSHCFRRFRHAAEGRLLLATGGCSRADSLKPPPDG